MCSLFGRTAHVGYLTLVLFCTSLLSASASSAALPDLKFYMQGHYTNVHTFDAAPIIGYMSNETLVGVLAAFHEVNAAGGLAGGRNLTLKLFDDKGFPELWGPRGNTTAAMNDPSVLGAVASKVLESFYVNPIARQLQMPVFGSTTIDQAELSQSTPNTDFLIHTQLPMKSDGVAAVNFATKAAMHCKTFAIVYVDAFGVKEVALEVISEIERIGLSVSVVVGADLGLNARPNQLAQVVVGKYMEAAVKPTCAILMVDASIVLAVVATMAAVLPPPTFDDFSFFATSVAALPQWINPSTGTSAAFKNLYFSSSYPSGHDRRFAFIRQFQTAIETLKQSQTSPVHSSFQPNTFAVDGYMAGRVLIETVNRIGIGKTVTRQSLKDAVYRTRTYVIDDVVLGPYSNGCIGQQTAMTGACWCTSGMKRLFFSRVDGTTGVTVPVFDPPHFPGIAEVSVPLTRCNIDAKTTLKRPFIAVAARDTLLPMHSGNEMTTSAGIGTHFVMASTAKVQSRAIENLRGIVRTAVVDNTLEHGPLMTLPVNVSLMTNATVKALATRYRLVFLMGAVYDPVKVYPVQFSGQEMTAAPEDTQSSSSTLPRVTSSSVSNVTTASADSAVHVLDIAPATSAFPDQDEPWRPPAAHFPLRVPFYPTLADLAVTAAAFSVKHLGLGVASPKISIVTDSDTLKTIATKSVETYARTSPTSAFVTSAGLSSSALDAVLNKANEAVTTGRTPSDALTTTTAVRWAGAVVVVTRRKEVIEAAVRSAAKTAASTVATIIAADEFVLEDVIRSMSVSASVSVSTNVFFTSGLPRYTTSAAADDQRVSATESYSSAIAATVKALYDLSGKTNGSAVEIAAEAYRNLAVPVAAAEISLSPLWADKCTGLKQPTWPHPGGECQCAKGLNTFFVRSFKDAVMNSTGRGDFSYRHSGCGPAFKALDPPAEDSPFFTTTTASIIAVGAAVLVFAAAALGITIWMSCCKRSARDNSNAPKNAAHAFTIVFTDIQASTRLWAHAPDRMGEALDVHHRLMREAIKRRRGYEVKTIGDSFMVAFQHPHDALRFAFDTQLMLYSHDMGTDVFDRVYREATAEANEAALHMIDQHYSDDTDHIIDGAAQANASNAVHDFDTHSDTQNPKGKRASNHWVPGVPQDPTPVEQLKHKYAAPNDSAHPLSPEDYAALWSGLRVRIGIHHGTGSIRLDETSQGYDYYGTVVNTAARVEGVGHGGQILVTGAAYECLGDAAVSQLQGAVVDLGAQPLRGLPEPVRLFQVLPEAFCARHFPPLRLDVENEVEMDDTTVDTAGEDTGNDTESKRTSGGTERCGQNVDVFGELAKKLRLRSPTASRLSIAAAFDAVSTLLAAMKPAGRRETLKALSAAWRVHGVWSGPHMRRLERASALSTEQLTLLATVGRAVQALEVQTRRSNMIPPNFDEAGSLDASISTTARGGVKAQPSFQPGLGFTAVQQVLEAAAARSTLPATAQRATSGTPQQMSEFETSGPLSARWKTPLSTPKPGALGTAPQARTPRELTVSVSGGSKSPRVPGVPEQASGEE